MLLQKFGKFFLLGAMLLLGLLSGCKQAPNVNSVEEIKGSIIGVQMGTVSDLAVSQMDGDEAGTEVMRFSSNLEALEALLQHKISCFILDQEPAKAFAAKYPNLKVLEGNFATDQYAAIIAKDNLELLSQVNEVLGQLKSDGTLDRIVEHYTSSYSNHGISSVTNFKHADDSAYTQPLILATDPSFPPFEYRVGDKIDGIDIEIGRAIAARMGRKLQVADFEFEAIINVVTSHKADIGLSGFSITEERKQFVSFSQPYVDTAQMVLVNANDNAVNSSLWERFEYNFINNDNYKFLVNGLFITIMVSFFACLIGVGLGTVIATIRVSHDLNGSCRILNWICHIYLTVIRGTPVMVQLMIVYFVIFSSVNIDKILVASLTFGINSAAYVAEIIRAGIMSIDRGQMEAGRALGLKYRSIMRFIILPQAFKNILPALANEFITLIKETSIVGFIGLADLTRGGMMIRNITYDAMFPLLSVAAIYLVMVVILTKLVAILEMRLKKNER